MSETLILSLTVGIFLIVIISGMIVQYGKSIDISVNKTAGILLRNIVDGLNKYYKDIRIASDTIVMKQITGNWDFDTPDGKFQAIIKIKAEWNIEAMKQVVKQIARSANIVDISRLNQRIALLIGFKNTTTEGFLVFLIPLPESGSLEMTIEKVNPFEIMSQQKLTGPVVPPLVEAFIETIKDSINNKYEFKETHVDVKHFREFPQSPSMAVFHQEVVEDKLLRDLFTTNASQFGLIAQRVSENEWVLINAENHEDEESVLLSKNPYNNLVLHFKAYSLFNVPSVLNS